jgi:hypothetical protein
VVFDSSVTEEKDIASQLDTLYAATNDNHYKRVILTTPFAAEGWNFYDNCNVICAMTRERITQGMLD